MTLDCWIGCIRTQRRSRAPSSRKQHLSFAFSQHVMPSSVGRARYDDIAGRTLGTLGNGLRCIIHRIVGRVCRESSLIGSSLSVHNVVAVVGEKDAEREQ